MEIAVIQSKIYEIRGVKVMLDKDLASLYQVEVRVLNQAVKRNIKTLSERGYIEREGAKKTGMWKVLKDK